MKKVEIVGLIICLLGLLSQTWAGVLPDPPSSEELAELTKQFRETQENIAKYLDQGEEICFTRPDGLWVMNADGTNAHLILATSPQYPNFWLPCWSLDGTHIVCNTMYYSGGVLCSDIVVCEANGQNANVIYTNDVGYSYNIFQSFSWSPDNQYIMFNYCYNDNLYYEYYNNCIVSYDGSWFWFDPDFPDCSYSQWDPNDDTRRAMVTNGEALDLHTRLRWRRLDGSYEEVWLIVQNEIAALQYCSWYNSSNIYIVLKDGSLVGYPDRQVVLSVTSSGYDIIAYSELDASLHSLSFSPDRQYLLYCEMISSTNTIYKMDLTSGYKYDLGDGRDPNWRQQIPGIEETADKPAEAKIDWRCHPNPFRDQTIISFVIPTASPVALSVYDVAGREVAIIVDEKLSAGHHLVRWRPVRLPNGIYFVKMETNTGIKLERLIHIE